jgi:hypothetical protein
LFDGIRKIDADEIAIWFVALAFCTALVSASAFAAVAVPPCAIPRW